MAKKKAAPKKAAKKAPKKAPKNVSAKARAAGERKVRARFAAADKNFEESTGGDR